MKRRILASLALGLLLPGAVAWTLAATRFRPNITMEMCSVPIEGHAFGAFVQDSIGFRQYMLEPSWRTPGTESYHGVTLEPREPPHWLRWRGDDVNLFKEGENFQETTEAWGWPTLCLKSGIERRMDGKTRVVWGAIGPHNGVTLNRTVPYVPIWPGYLINTLIYAAAAFALLSLLARLQSIRRDRKARSGICLSCGYHVGSLATCPECGHQNPASTDARAQPPTTTLHSKNSGE